MTGNSQRAFCAVRPPGHHATPDRGMGFCIYNTIAIAARYAQRKHGVERVLIVDWDVHHGNGTQDTFYDRRLGAVLQHPPAPVVSRHRDDAGVGRRERERAGRSTVPCRRAPAAKQILGAVDTELMPAAERSSPTS